MINSSQPIVLFDGVCNFCNNSINFVIRHDQQALFRFAPLQSGAGQQLLQQYGMQQQTFDSFVLIENGKTFVRSTAALKVAARLPWYWQWLQAGWLLPRPLRDAVYNWIARNRYRWFGKKESCMVPTAEVRGRFLN